ncbi:MAG: hypothetical protein WCJ64_04855 [Rhodospirillaceae bacterium]
MSLLLVQAFKMVRGKAPLPKVLAEIAEVAGHENALKIARKHGGAVLRVPVREATLDDAHPIVRLIGREAALRFCFRFSCERVRVPIGPFHHGIHLLYEFAKLRKNGHSIAKASHEVRVHPRTGTRWEALISGGTITNNDFAAYGRLIGDDWNSSVDAGAPTAPLPVECPACHHPL